MKAKKEAFKISIIFNQENIKNLLSFKVQSAWSEFGQNRIRHHASKGEVCKGKEIAQPPSLPKKNKEIHFDILFYPPLCFSLTLWKYVAFTCKWNSLHYPWYLYLMVTKNMLRTQEGLFGGKIRFMKALVQIKRLKQIK